MTFTDWAKLQQRKSVNKELLLSMRPQIFKCNSHCVAKIQSQTAAHFLAPFEITQNTGKQKHEGHQGHAHI